jgi:ADP-ribose pyrophosphatase YjhB (NUDIX family)
LLISGFLSLAGLYAIVAEKMMSKTNPRWLQWAREIQALSQTSITYAENEYQRERYTRLSEIASEIIAEHTNHEASDVIDVLQIQRGYATPKIDVRAAIFKEDKLLLVKERADDGWCMPGGWADVGDTPSNAVERETQEETGFEVKARKLIGVYDANRLGELVFFHAFKLVFLCEIRGGESRPSNETSEVVFYSGDEIPSRLSGERTKQYHIQDAFDVFKDPSLPTKFD